MEKLVSQNFYTSSLQKKFQESAERLEKSGTLLKDVRLSQLRYYISPENDHELQIIHREAPRTALIYLSTIICLYLAGLLLILIHYMNSSYGKWTWTIHDVWDEIR